MYRRFLQFKLFLQTGLNGVMNSTNAITIQSIAREYIASKEYDLAEAEIKEAIGIAEATMHPSDRRYLVIKADLGNVLYETNRFDEAELIYKNILAMEKQTHGKDSAAQCELICNLAKTLIKQNKFDEANEILSGTLMEARLAEFGYTEGRIIQTRGWLNERNGDLPQAKRDYIRALHLFMDNGCDEECENECRSDLFRIDGLLPLCTTTQEVSSRSTALQDVQSSTVSVQ